MNEPMQRQRGFTLVELMIALVLGLLVVGGVVELFLSNRQVYRQNENLARLQESARYAFEIMARDLREAGGVACGRNLPTANVLNNVEEKYRWWRNWNGGIRGFEGDDNTFESDTDADNRVSGTDAVIVHSGTANDGVYITEHNPESAQFKVNTTAHGIVDGDILLVCDYRQAAIFQTTNANASNVTIVHNTGSPVWPGNCSKGLGYPTVCTTNGTPYTFKNGGFISKLSAHAWYIGCNGRVGCNDPGGRSLYRLTLRNSNGTAETGPAEEIAEGVTGLQIEYLTSNSGTLASQYVDADAISDWTSVVAARLTFTFQTLEKVGTDIHPIERNWYTVVSLRNRLP